MTESGRGSDKIEGVDGEKWNSWLVIGKDEVLEIPNDKLRTHVRILARRPDLMNTPDYLQNAYTDIEKMLLSGEITDSETAPWLSRIADRHQFLIEQEKLSSAVSSHPLERQIPAREQPLYLGAVFADGQNEPYLVDTRTIERVNVGKEEDRRKFIFRNVYAFDFLYLKSSEMSPSWLGAVKNWESDFKVAQEKLGTLGKNETGEFYLKLRAAMAITASARAMEISGGSFNDYGMTLTGGERGPNSNWQDKNGVYLLHADPEKIRLLLEDPTVFAFYSRLIKDSGLKNDNSLEWGKKQEPNNLSLRPDFDKDKSELIRYLSDSAKNGGFDGYIDEVLLTEVKTKDSDTRVRKAAAKLACDIFLVDKWTRWEELVTDGSSKISSDMSLQPCVEWAGDPLKSIIKPTFLPRLKKVYSGPDEIVLDILDKAFRPTDIYDSISYNHRVLYNSPVDFKTRLPVASMVTNLKTLIRYNGALDKVLGGPMAANVPSWSQQTLGDITGPGGVLDLVDQVYGTQKIKVPEDDDPSRTRDFEIGKHIAGDVVMRIMYAKALAITLESAKPGFMDKMDIMFNPENKLRPYFELLTFLAGARRDGKSGFVKTIQGGRLDFVVDGNLFTARKYYKELVRLLETNDQTGRTSNTILNTTGFVLDVGKALANAANLIGGR